MPPGTTGRGDTASVRTGRRESAEERADRRWSDLLQEVRVAQTGSQILFGHSPSRPRSCCCCGWPSAAPQPPGSRAR
ncbi:DUF6328 family protein [Streptomyces sp. XY431]|uniref:DUF6328 family protein n=1 Tax=Streptomyces sp. XY431 TaxID=1415562 RepID=UPI00336BF340